MVLTWTWKASRAVVGFVCCISEYASFWLAKFFLGSKYEPMMLHVQELAVAVCRQMQLLLKVGDFIVDPGMV